MIDAIRRGDLEAVRRHLDQVPPSEQWQDGGRAFGAAVLRHGGPGLVELLYDKSAVPSGPWGEFDPVVWAAEHGACGLLEALLSRYPQADDTLRRALDAARAWWDIDPVAELRRRMGVGEDEAVTVGYDEVVVDEFHPRSPRIRVSARGNRTGEVLLTHRGVVAILEGALGLPVSHDELLARALWSADPDSWDWSAARTRMRRQFPVADNVKWVIGRLADPEVAVRRFAAEMMHHITIEEAEPDVTYTPAARAALRARMAVEPDAEVMNDVIGAYGGFWQTGDIVHDLLPLAVDPRPQVRARVAIEVLSGFDQRITDPPAPLLPTLLALVRDPEPAVRVAATATLAHGPLDTPELRGALAACSADEDRRVRIDAAAGLALRGDAQALVQLRRLSAEDGYESHAWNQVDSVERMLGLSS